ncbi:MAG: ThiF family adenylyltransferase, partial [Terriglobales bacterium]
RFLLNDYAVQQRIPWIYTAAVGAYGLTMNIIPGETACLRCIFPAAPAGAVETCDTAGILNSAVNLFASIAATEALKFLVGAGVGMNDGVNGKIRRTLLSYDLWTNQRSEMNVAQPRPDCETCQRRDFSFLAGEGRPQITLCGRNSVQIHERHRPLVFGELYDKLKSHGKVMHNDFVLKFWRDPYEMTLFPDGRAIIKGTTDTAIARSLYARYIGS